jgi:iron-sulfur cluster assembly accessory protein
MEAAADAATPAAPATPGWTEADTIHLTPSAIESIRELRVEYGGEGAGLRFGLSGGGCSGYKYVIEFEEGPAEGDLIIDHDGVQVFVNPVHMEKLKNSTIDWKESLMEAGFSIENPQAKRPCGCGASVDF